MRRAELLIITGISGSGKTTFLKTLEELGYYCIDNLPTDFIPSLIDYLLQREEGPERIAIVVDIRERQMPEKFPALVEALRQKTKLRVIFLEASDDSIVKRYKLMRRRHPLEQDLSLTQAIELERKLLQKVKELSDEIWDTTDMPYSQLRRRIMDRFMPRRRIRPFIKLVSFGFWYGIPQDTDLLFDVRPFPNPYWDEELRKKTGKDKRVRDYIFSQQEMKRFFESLKNFFERNLELFFLDGRNELTISVGCTGGKHRSVALVEELAKWFRDKGKYNVRVYHRDIHKG